MSSRFDWVIVLPLCWMLTACVSGETTVKQAAQQRWNALLAGDLQQAYQYYTDAFKQTVPYEHFRNSVQGVGLWSKAQVQKVSCDTSGDKCNAEVEVTVAMKMRGLPKPVETSDVIHETWTKEGSFSDWRYVKK